MALPFTRQAFGPELAASPTAAASCAEAQACRTGFSLCALLMLQFSHVTLHVRGLLLFQMAFSVYTVILLTQFAGARSQSFFALHLAQDSDDFQSVASYFSVEDSEEIARF